MPSPATTVDSKATNSIEEGKPAQEERAPVARSEMRQSIPDHAASGPETLDPARTPTQSSSDAAGVKKSALSTAPSGWKRIGTVSEDASGSRSQLDPPRSGHGDASRASRVSASIPTEPKAFRGETEAASLTLPSPLDAVTPDLYRQSPAATATAEQKGAVAVVTREPKPISSKEQEALAPSRSTPESQAQKRSFGHVPLPTEMPTEIRAKDYYVEYDPALSKSKSRGKDIIRRSRSLKGDATPVVDPRLQQAKERGRRGDRRRKEHAGHFVRTKFDFDKHSVGDRPPPPPRQLLITGISPRTNSAQVLNLLRSFGSIEEHKLGLNTITGQSLGIFSVTFADDYDEDGKPLELASSRLTLQNGNEVAKKALAAMQGWKMGADTFAVRLDRGRKRFDEACRRSIAHFVDAQKRAAASTGTVEKAASGNIGSRASSTSAGPSTGSHGNGTQVEASPTASMLPPSAPRAHRAPPSRPTAASASAFRSSPLDRASRESEASVSPHRFRSLRMSPAHRSRHDELDSRRHFGTHSVSDHSAGSHRTTSSTNPYGTGASGPVRALPAHGDEYADGNPATEPTEAILRRLHKLGHAYVYISRSNARDVGLSALRSHFEAMHFTPDFVSADDDGFYVAFDVSNAASRAHKVLNGSTVGGYRISIEVRDAPRASDCDRSREAGSGRSGPSSAAELFQRKRALMGQATPEAIDPIRSEYTPDELAEMTFKLIQSELVEKLGLKVKSTLVTTLVTDFMKEGGVGGQIMKQALVGSGDRTAAEVKGDASTSDVALPHFRKVPGTISRDVLDMKIPKKASAVVSETASRKTAPSPASTTKPKQTGGKRTRAVPNGPENGWWSTDEDEPNSKPESSKATRSGPTGSTDRKRLSGFSDDEDQDRSAVASRSVSASVEPSELGHTVPDAKTKTKSARKPSKKRLKAEVILGDEGISTAPNEALEDAASEKSSFAAPPKRASAKKSKPAKAIRAGSPVGDPFVAGVAEDEDDLYYVKLAIERGRDGLPTVEEDWPDPELESAEAEDPLTGDAASTSRQAGHATGSARTEEVYRIPAADKAAHLPDRNKQNKEDSHNVLALASARNNRADSRRLVLGIEQHKKETATDTDILKINQLRTRKKQLKFSKSPIHDWGLYAMEKILPGDMVIEYVGEVVRQQVADEREKQYERQGNFSTYLFRVDDDLVVDATHKGNIARLMNHCCTPNCNAKILTLNGEKRIVLFARTVINPGDELTYDYKFQASADDEDAIACLCGSPGCRRFL